MRLGYERIVKDKMIIIEVEESDDPLVALKIKDSPEIIRIKASDTTTEEDLKCHPAMQNDIMKIADAVHLAYFEANKPF